MNIHDRGLNIVLSDIADEFYIDFYTVEQIYVKLYSLGIIDRKKSEDVFHRIVENV